VYPQGDSNEPPKPAEKQALSAQGGTDSGTLAAADPLAPLAAALLGLSAADRARLAAMLMAGQPEGKAAGGPQTGVP
jgi:hypothetical protein